VRENIGIRTRNEQRLEDGFIAPPGKDWETALDHHVKQMRALAGIPPPRMANSLSPSGYHYSRYLDGIGYVTSDSPGKLDRACEIALTQRFDHHERLLTDADRKLEAFISIQASKTAVERVRDERLHHYQNMQSVIKAIEILHNKQASP
jgi:hypothetical protein